MSITEFTIQSMIEKQRKKILNQIDLESDYAIALERALQLYDD